MDVLTGKKTFTSLKPVDLSTCTRKEILDYFNNTYDVYESLFLGLRDASTLYKCPDRLRLPLVFYYAHTAVVFVNKLMLAGLLKERINMEFEILFETGVDEMSWDDTENYRMGGKFQWPSISEVVDYRKKVREVIVKIIQDTPLQLPITMGNPWWAVLMGIEHERIHLETSAVLIRQLPVRLVTCPNGWKYGPAEPEHPLKANRMVSVPETKVTFGKPENFPSFGWDDEYGEITQTVPAFEASQYLVTNKDFLEFVQAGGYSTRDLWTEEGWQWVSFRQARHPTFWVCDQGCKSGCGGDLARETHCPPRPALINESTNEPETKKAKSGEYRLRLMFDVVDMPLSWPVEVNLHEVNAFCKWKGQGYRTLTEAEHNVIRGKQLPLSAGTQFDIMYHDNIQANLNMNFGSSTPVNMFAPTSTGHYDVMGNVSEWTEDHFNGLPGFQTHSLYDDYSAPCFDGKHNIFLGGSWMSTGAYGSRFARIGFRRHFFQFCGFRLARSKGDNPIPVRAVNTEVFVLGCGVEAPKHDLAINGNTENSENGVVWEESSNTIYTQDTLETLEGIRELEFGFRDSLPRSVVDMCVTWCRDHGVATQSAVNLGSSTGRACFELSKTFDKIVGVEPFGRLLDTALSLQSGSKVKLSSGAPVEMDSCYCMEKIFFKQLTWIANEVDSSDLVLLSHLDRVHNQKAWLLRLWEIVRPGGVAVIASRHWSKKEIEPLFPALNKRLECVEVKDLEFDTPKGKQSVSVTFWTRKE